MPYVPTADLLATLSNPIRLEILASIAKAEKCVSDIAQELQLDASTVSRSLAILSERQLVDCRPIKTRRIYRLSDAIVASDQGSTLRFDITTDEVGRKLSFEMPS